MENSVGNVNKFFRVVDQVERLMVMFTGTTIDELLNMVQKAENQAETKVRLQEEMENIPVLLPPGHQEFYRPSNAPLLMGVA